MFMSLIEELTEKGRGMHAYAATAKTAFAQASAHPDQAAAFYLLGKIAEEFVDLHERMPLSTEELNQFFGRYAAAAQALQDADDKQDAAGMLAALNAVAGQMAAKG